MRRPTPHTVASRTVLTLAALLPPFLFYRGRMLVDGDGRELADPSRRLIDLGTRWYLEGDFGTFDRPEESGAAVSAPIMAALNGIGVAPWIAQRLVIAALLLGAALGMVRLLRAMRWEGALGAPIAALAYMLSPYPISIIGSGAAVLLAWSTLPWLVLFMLRSLEQPGWRYPCAFAVVTGLAGAGHPAALVYCLFGSLLWALYATAVTRDIAWRVAGMAMARVSAAAAVVSVGWLVPMIVRHRLTMLGLASVDPSAPANRSSSALDVLRGVGDWRGSGTEIATTRGSDAAVSLRTNPVLQVATLLIPAIGLLSACLHRFRNRLFFLGVIVIGLLLGVGSFPRANPEPYGRLLRRLSDTTLGGLLTPSQRAIPIVMLGICACFGAGVERWALQLRRPRAVAAVGIAVIAGAAAPWWTGEALNGPALAQRSSVTVIDDSIGVTKRVLEWPPANGKFNNAWLLDVSIASLLPNVAVVNGNHVASSPSAAVDTMTGLYAALEQRRIRPSAIQPILRLLGITDIVIHDYPDDPMLTASVQAVFAAASGIVRTDGLVPGRGTWYSVTNPVPPLRIAGASSTVIAALSASGIIDLANAGLLTGDEVIVNASAVDNPREFQAGAQEAPLVLSDTTRWRDQVLRASGSSLGATVRPGVIDLVSDDSSNGDVRAPVDGSDVSAFTTVDQKGVNSVRATRYGPLGGYDIDARPALAFDDRTETAWQIRPSTSAPGNRIEVALSQKSSLDHVDVTPFSSGSATHRIGSLRLFLDDSEVLVHPLSGSETAPIRLTFARQQVSRVSVEIVSVVPNQSEAHVAAATSADLRDDSVGLSEVAVAGVTVTEITKLPRVLETFLKLGPNRPLVISLSRDAASGDGPNDDTMVREWQLPVARPFSLRGLASSPTPIGPSQVNVCRDDLVRLRGAAVEVQLTPTDAPPDGRAHYALEGCGPSIELDADAQVLFTVVADSLRVDQIILSSGLSGKPLSDRAGQLTPAQDLAREPAAVSYSASVGSIKESGLLVLNQAHDLGWSARLDGDDLGEPLLVNGSAMAWSAVARPGSSHDVVVRWEPQRTFSLYSLVALGAWILALVVACIGRRDEDGTTMLSATNELNAVHSSVIVLLTLGVFGIAGGAAAGLVAGIGALAIERWPMLRAAIAWTVPISLLGVGVIQMIGAIRDTDTPGEPASWVATHTAIWVAIALAATVAMATSDRRPVLGHHSEIRRYEG